MQEDSEGNLWSRFTADCQKLRGKRKRIADGWQCWDTALSPEGKGSAVGHSSCDSDSAEPTGGHGPTREERLWALRNKKHGTDPRLHGGLEWNREREREETLIEVRGVLRERRRWR